MDVVGSRYHLLWKKDVIIGCQVATTTIVWQQKVKQIQPWDRNFCFEASRAQTGRVKTLELDKAGFFQLRTLTEPICVTCRTWAPKRAKSRRNGHRRATTMPALGIRTPRIGTTCKHVKFVSRALQNQWILGFEGQTRARGVGNYSLSRTSTSTTNATGQRTKSTSIRSRRRDLSCDELSSVVKWCDVALMFCVFLHPFLSSLKSLHLYCRCATWNSYVICVSI